MPLYMDRHNGLDVTAKAVAEAHQLDLAKQEEYQCKALTYWFDEGKAIAFCLIEAPDMKSVEELHRNSHGLVPNQIIEVESNVVELFLGRVSDPEAQKGTRVLENFINETGFRTIMYLELKHSLLRKLKPGESFEIPDICNNLIRNSFKQYGGREVEFKGNGFLASFTSVSNSVKCAIEIQKSFKEYSNKNKGNVINASIGLCSGAPVTERNDFFGDTILLAKRLCEIADEGQVKVSSTVRDFYKERKLIISEVELIKILDPSEEKFLNQLMELTEHIWNDAGFNVDNLSKQIGLSKAQLYRKTTSLTGASPNEFIRNYRLNKALKLIEKKRGNISEIAFESGFGNPSYFSKCFQKRFGILPSDYANTIA